MLIDRIIGAITFRRGIYAQVEGDAAFTSTAWLLVAVVAFLNQLGTNASSNLAGWLIGAVAGTISVLIGFALAALIISWVGQKLFNAQVSFEELVRTLGLAYVWNIVGFIGVLAAFSSALTCVLAPVTFLAAVLGLVAWFMAAKEALDLDWVQTIITVFIGWLAMFILMAAVRGVVGLLI